jgi:hypothetical protein
MGGTSSKNKVKSLQENIAKIASTSVSRCTTTVGMYQNVSQTTSGISIGTSQSVVQNTTIKSSCLNDTQRTTQMATEIANQIAQTVSSESVGGVGALNTTSATADSTTLASVRSALTTKNITENFQKIMSEQIAAQRTTGISIFTSQKVIQGTEVYAEAVNKSLEENGIYADLESTINQQASATTTNPLDVFFAWIPWIIVGMVFISLGVIWLFYARPELAQQLIFAFTSARAVPSASGKTAAVKPVSATKPVPSVSPRAPIGKP